MTRHFFLQSFKDVHICRTTGLAEQFLIFYLGGFRRNGDKKNKIKEFGNDKEKPWRISKYTRTWNHRIITPRQQQKKRVSGVIQRMLGGKQCLSVKLRPGGSGWYVCSITPRVEYDHFISVVFCWVWEACTVSHSVQSSSSTPIFVFSCEGEQTSSLLAASLFRRLWVVSGRTHLKKKNVSSFHFFFFLQQINAKIGAWI